ncbi:MAG: DUF4124 domain-containing protein [Gammaproteobacteria bacterium]|nr:MAG: DUF4124 domain-containing protein [Gammaproteobacteria bacterium]
MRISLTIFIVMLITTCLHNVQAEIYTCKDAKGNTVYTDSPSACANAEEVKVDALPTLIPTKSLVTSNSNRAVKEDDKNAYSELVITSPSNDATFRDNQGNLTINFRVNPALQTRKGHKFVVTVGGAEVYTGTSTITALNNVDRGTHVITVKVVDADGSAKITATPVSVTLQRYSALQNTENSSNDGSDDPGITRNGNLPSNTKFNRQATPPPPPPAPAPPSPGINN